MTYDILAFIFESLELYNPQDSIEESVFNMSEKIQVKIQVNPEQIKTTKPDSLFKNRATCQRRS